jgi:hypothetical protein
MIATRSLLGSSAAVEAGTGLALLALPRTVVRLLLGAGLRGAGVVTSRVCGAALLALGLACRPDQRAPRPEARTRAVRVLLGYNALVAAYLARLRISRRYRGIALVPAFVLHALFAGLSAGRIRRAGS